MRYHELVNHSERTLIAMDSLDDTAISHIASYFQVLSEPTRLKILNALRMAGERSVGELAEQFGCTAANVSKHLSLLAKGGFVTRQSRGNSVYYRIADPAVFELCNLVCGQVGRVLTAQAQVAGQLFAAHGESGKPH